MNKKVDNKLQVIRMSRESKCHECNEELDRSALVYRKSAREIICLTCADLDHLVFLPSGDTALTRRSRKHSKLSAEVMEFSNARKRYERQGLLVENDAIEIAEKECEADEKLRKTRRDNASVRRAELDKKYVNSFAERILEVYPYCPDGQSTKIAEHACRKYSGRVGRSAAAKVLNENTIRLAVIAHIRHTETNYDELLYTKMVDRNEARKMIHSSVTDILDKWESGIS